MSGCRHTVALWVGSKAKRMSRPGGVWTQHCLGVPGVWCGPEGGGLEASREACSSWGSRCSCRGAILASLPAGYPTACRPPTRGPGMVSAPFFSQSGPRTWGATVPECVAGRGLTSGPPTRQRLAGPCSCRAPTGYMGAGGFTGHLAPGAWETGPGLGVGPQTRLPLHLPWAQLEASNCHLVGWGDRVLFGAGGAGQDPTQPGHSQCLPGFSAWPWQSVRRAPERPGSCRVLQVKWPGSKVPTVRWPHPAFPG